jgi:hypothetical protein
MAHSNLPAPTRQATASTVLAASGLVLVLGGLVVGIVLSTDSLDVRELTRTSAWLVPALFLGIGTLLAGVILRFVAILASLRLRLAALREHLPALIPTEGGRS